MVLKQYLFQTGMSRREFAVAIGVSEVSITRYIGGTRTPSREEMLRIVTQTGGAVTPNDFYNITSADAPPEPIEAAE